MWIHGRHYCRRQRRGRMRSAASGLMSIALWAVSGCGSLSARRFGPMVAPNSRRDRAIRPARPSERANRLTVERGCRGCRCERCIRNRMGVPEDLLFRPVAHRGPGCTVSGSSGRCWRLISSHDGLALRSPSTSGIVDSAAQYRLFGVRETTRSLRRVHGPTVAAGIQLHRR